MAKLDEEIRQHILYAQCALLDEVITGRNVQNDDFLQWNGISLQKYFPGKYQALYELERGRLVKAFNERLKPVNGQQKPLTHRSFRTRYDLTEWLTLWPLVWGGVCWRWGYYG